MNGLWEDLGSALWSPFDLNDRFCVVYLLTGLAFCAVRGYATRQAFQAWLSDPVVRRALALDIVTFVSQKLILWLLISPVFFLAPWRIAASLTGASITLLESPFEKGLYWLIEFLLIDVSFFSAHILQHRIPALWVFHEVHHSAERLNPFTAFRVHPIDDLVTLLMLSVVTSFVLVLTSLGFGILPRIDEGINPGLLVFFLAGFVLRHSEIPLSWGKVGSRWLMSPVQHQWHHSRAPEDRDIHFGFVLTVWDQCLGTYRDPSAVSPPAVGVLGCAYPTWRHLMITPWQHVLETRRGALWFFVLLFLMVTVFSSAWRLHQEEWRSQSLRLEELRTDDVAQGIAHGWTTLIIPTGGVEQNGAHLLLGKHNVVLRESALRLAKRLGRAYVAPIVPYVPNGDIEIPSGHMRFSGSFSIGDLAYANYLEDIAKSARVQGFKTIVFMHGHGQSGPVERSLAERLSRRWEEGGTRVIALESYTDETQIRADLHASGWSEEILGTHAGVIDTAEVMAVYPAGIWFGSLGQAHPGQDGEAARATPALGEEILARRLRAAEDELMKKLPRRPE